MTHQPQHDLFLPAEWAEQSAIQLTWPHADTDWLPYLDDITETFIALTGAIARFEPVIIATPYPDQTMALLRERIGSDLCLNVHCFGCATNDTWARDHGAITLMPAQDTGGEGARLLDFRFNGWGEKFNWEHDNAITRHLCDKGVFCGKREDHDDFVLEGGSIESDGAGTIMTTSFCLMAPHRNQPLTREQIEQRLLRDLRAERVLWLNHGLLIGDDTDGHIDTIVRLAPHDTLLYVHCDDASDEQFADFLALETELQALRTRDGKPYRLMPLPMPDAMFDDGERLPATYANFVILNGAVIVPTYGQPEKDAQALHTVQQAFPSYEIIGIDASTVVRQHGSLHCLTMQYPKGVFINKE
jgi:agmatine/peptidylarginine deiminase